IDFSTEEGALVYVVYGGTVSDITTTVTKGVSVTVDHGNGLLTVYNSLESADEVEVGEVLEQGDAIGRVSTTNRQEYSDGPHLHFEVIEGGENINPEKYLAINEK
ncbi:MAG: M23 family metallopeptidase, partial [Clostridia bacterium]|nr:M23 family metallopeptidase [Clostridia bacterium]